MATQPTLASLLGSSDKRKQVSLDLGQQALTPQVQRAGQRTVFAAPTVAAEQTSAGRLAAALSDVSPVLRQYTDLTYTQGQTEAAAVLPGNAEARLKKMEPDTWLNMARQRGLREGLIKKHFNHNLLHEFKEQAKEYQNFEKYPTIEKATEAFDGYIADRWSQYVEEMPDGIGGSLESKVLWSSITGNVRNGVIDSYNRNLDKFNVSSLSDETQQKWSVLTTADDEGNIDYGSATSTVVSDFYALGKKAGLTSQDITDRLRIDMVNRVQTLQKQGKNKQAQEAIKVLRAYRRNGQLIFNDAVTNEQLAEVENGARNAMNTAANRSRVEIDRENDLNAERIEALVLNLNEGLYDLNHPDIARIIPLYTDAPVQEVLDDINNRITSSRATPGDALFESLKVFNVNGSDEQRDSFVVVSNAAQAGINRHYSMKPKLQRLESIAEKTNLSNYEKALYSEATQLGPEGYFSKLGFRLMPEQREKAGALYERAIIYNTDKAANEDQDKLFESQIRENAVDIAVAKTFTQNMMLNQIDPLRRQRAEAIQQGAAVDSPEIIDIDNQIKELKKNGVINFKTYETELEEYRTREAVFTNQPSLEDARKSAKIDIDGKRQVLQTISRPAPRVVSAVVRTGKEWTTEQIESDRRLALQAKNDDALEISIHRYPFILDYKNEEDFIEKNSQMKLARMDITDKVMFNDPATAVDTLQNALNASLDFKRGQLDLNKPINRAYLTFAQQNGIKTQEDAEALLDVIEYQLKQL